MLPLDYPLKSRVAIYGSGGKTTLGKAIALKISVPFIELDALRHQKDWLERPNEEMRLLVQRQIEGSPEGWVVEGNYTFVRPTVLAQAESVVVIELPFRVLFWRILLRSLRRSWKREELWNGNKESWRITFASRYSVLCEVIRKRKIYSSYGQILGNRTPHRNRSLRHPFR